MSLPPFEHLVGEHGPTVMRVCMAIVGPEKAEDVWSETFLAALRAYPRLRPNSNLRGWLATIAHHKAIDRIRADARAPLPLAELPEPGAPAHAAEPLLPAQEPVLAALAALPAKQRGAVAYHYLADLPYAEVAMLLGTSEAAARRSASDGIASLRKALGATVAT